LCPVGGEPLVDHALRAVTRVTDRVAVNAHAFAQQVVDHVRARWPHVHVHVAVEQPEPLGTAGALGNLRGWIDGRDVVVHNADAWHRADLGALLVDGWDGERMRLMVVPTDGVTDFGRHRYAGVAILPWRGVVERLRPEPSGLYEVAFRDAHERGELDLVTYDGPWFDCGTLADYQAADQAASTPA
jgi:MurNAc alpha-1-phosphate uridylyltransferase